MSINKHAPYGGTKTTNTSEKDNKFLTAVIQQVALAVNISNDTVSVIRRENDVLCDLLPIDRMRPDTNGPRVIMGDCVSAVDRIVAQVSKAFYEERSVEATALNKEDKEASDQCTKMTRHAIFSLNNGKMLSRLAAKSAAKYPFGGGARIIRQEKEIFSDYTMYLQEVQTMEEAEEQARVIATQNTKEDYVVWKLLKVKQEKYEVPATFEDQPVVDQRGKVMMTEQYRYKAMFEICKYVVCHDILLIPPEELLLNKGCTSLDDAMFVAQRRLMSRSDIVAMWPDANKELGDLGNLVYSQSYNTGFNNEKQYRRRVHNTLNITQRPALIEESMQESVVIEGFVKYDYNEDKQAEWRHFAIVDNILLENAIWEGPVPFVLASLNQDPHRPDSLTVVERARDSQLAKTAILRADIKAHQARSSMQIVARMNGFPLTGQRKLIDGTPGIIPFGNNEQGAQVPGMSGPLNDNVLVLPKPDPSQASVAMLGYIDQQKGNQVGINSLNDVAGAHSSRVNPATNAAIQQRNSDIAIEDAIMCFGETFMRPLFQKMWWFIVQDATHPCINERFIKVTGKSCLDVEKGQVGEFFERDEFKINVGLGVDSPDYQNYKAQTMLGLLANFNQAMAGQTLPNLMPKVFWAYQEAVKSLGYDPDNMLMNQEEFDQYHQQLIQQHQQAAQNPPKPDPIQMATVQLLQAQAQSEQAKAQDIIGKMRAEIDKLRAEAQFRTAEAQKSALEAQTVIPLAVKQASETQLRVSA